MSNISVPHFQIKKPCQQHIQVRRMVVSLAVYQPSMFCGLAFSEASRSVWNSLLDILHNPDISKRLFKLHLFSTY